jgi:sulfatase maturation enzyme AslB (radical SAM superfamily)
MIAGERVSDCANCHYQEDNGANSLRIRYSEEWIEKLNIKSIDDVQTKIISYDIRNDNLCNLSCRMCSPNFSSQLEKEFALIPGWGTPKRPVSAGLADVADIETMQYVQVAGGEPTLMPGFRKFLTKAIDAGRTDVKVRINTNATNVNAEIKELLSQFTDLDIICSIDGFDQVNKYIRWPADWETIVNNIHVLTQITPYMAFNVTVSIWNISSLSKLIKFLSAEFPNLPVLLTPVYSPGNKWKYTTFPNKDLAIQDLTELKKYYPNDNSYQANVDFYISEMQKTTIDLVALAEFFKYNDTLDKSRGIRLIDYIPELEDCRALITNQI